MKYCYFISEAALECEHAIFHKFGGILKPTKNKYVKIQILYNGNEIMVSPVFCISEDLEVCYLNIIDSICKKVGKSIEIL